MDIEKMTLRVRNALNDAFSEAVKNHNQQVDTIHLTYALVNQEDGLIPNILEKMGVSVDALKNTLNSKINNMPKVYGEGANSQGVTATRGINDILVKSENIMQDFKDQYISVEHVFLAIIENESNTDIGKLFKTYSITKSEFLNVLHQIRGNQRVDSNDPEGTYDSLAKYGTNLVDLAKKHKLDPVI
jgi:ATP-dependent Clp protease ATP-binding subunit ClpB